jgi:hypothetical protein
VAIFDSLRPAIVLHALIDRGSGARAWWMLRERQATGQKARTET